jgi:hypothetical protein
MSRKKNDENVVFVPEHVLFNRHCRCYSLICLKYIAETINLDKWEKTQGEFFIY